MTNSCEIEAVVLSGSCLIENTDADAWLGLAWSCVGWVGSENVGLGGCRHHTNA
jgi:hypothetical protein